MTRINDRAFAQIENKMHEASRNLKDGLNDAAAAETQYDYDTAMEKIRKASSDYNAWKIVYDATK
ncbi:MAG: hypothetical protein H0U23_04830 [Blastocatellia bacterium]|nr:hypothetical protein [Blastocatellia bacterium]